MQSRFGGLRASIYSNMIELKRFRQVVVNAVLATDFVDDQLVSLRKSQWEKAFVENYKDSSNENLNRKAKIVIEMLIQSSDIFHATQNWHLYQKWNERHFQEMYKAFQVGRLTQDPSVFWLIKTHLARLVGISVITRTKENYSYPVSTNGFRSNRTQQQQQQQQHDQSHLRQTDLLQQTGSNNDENNENHHWKDEQIIKYFILSNGSLFGMFDYGLRKIRLSLFIIFINKSNNIEDNYEHSDL